MTGADCGRSEGNIVSQVPALNEFEQAADASAYFPLPDDWVIGVSDVVDSTSEIDAGRYKAVNLAGAATISAVANALAGRLPLFTFAGDGARFAVAAEQSEAAAAALSRVSMWAGRELGLDLRVGMTTVGAVRAAGFDVRAAFWRASENVRYAMFAGDGIEWAEAQLKQGRIALAPSAEIDDPDLTGLSCQWGPIEAKNGNILSLIVKRGAEATDDRFAEIAAEIVSLLEATGSTNPVPGEGPAVEWPVDAFDLQSRVTVPGIPAWLRGWRLRATTALAWIIFTLKRPLGGFDPERYRREIAENTDFRKYDDGLLMTVDCTSETIARVRSLLFEAAARGIVRYGLHIQDEALVTCIAPSVSASDHMHFVDGASGGYAQAARVMRGPTRPARRAA